jgi:hypothetical protein
MKSPIVALAGRRIDAIDDDSRTFPSDAVERVSAVIAAYLRRISPTALVSAAACGSDLIALRAAGILGIRRMVILPYDRDLFRKTSVRDRPGDWDDYDQIICEVVSEAGVEELGFEEPSPAAFRAVNKAFFDRASALGYPVRACVVWEGGPQVGTDYTAEFREFAQESGIPVDEVLI